MLEPINLIRFSKYGFITALSAFLAFLAEQNTEVKSVLTYGWFCVVFLGMLACFWKRVLPDEGGVTIYLLSNTQKFELMVIVCLITFGAVVGMS